MQKTVMKKLKDMNYNMDELIKSSLSNQKHFVADLDNNQKVNVAKYQRNGSSNEVAKVSGHFFKTCDSFNVEDHVGKSTVEGHVKISCVSQVIPSVFLLPEFENVFLLRTVLVSLRVKKITMISG